MAASYQSCFPLPSAPTRDLSLILRWRSRVTHLLERPCTALVRDKSYIGAKDYLVVDNIVTGETIKIG